MEPTRKLPAPAVPQSAGLRFTTTARTRWSDEDKQGVLNNAVYPTLLEEARYAYFAALGLLDEARFPFLLLQTNLRFLQPGRGAATVEIEVATTGMGRSSFSQAYRVRDPETGAVWCEAEAVLVLVDPSTGAPRAMRTFARRSSGRRSRRRHELVSVRSVVGPGAPPRPADGSRVPSDPRASSSRRPP